MQNKASYVFFSYETKKIISESMGVIMKRICAILLVLCFLMGDVGAVRAAEDSHNTGEEQETIETEVTNEEIQEDVESYSEDPFVNSDEDNYSDTIIESKDNTNDNISSEQVSPEEDPKENANADNKESDIQLENSWRYKNGELIIAESYRNSNSNAWEKVNGVYVNDKGEPIKNAAYKGIDVSAHQGQINWEKVKADGIDFAIIRCGYGSNFSDQDDKWWEYNASECERLGIPYGVYIYSYATTVEKASSEADHVLRLIKEHNLSYPVYFDMEDNTTQNLGSDLLGKIAKTFCDKISAAGYEVGIYANLNWWNNYLTSSVFDNPNWSKWVAQYNSYCAYEGEYDMWQCTSTGSVDGINGNVDLNFWLESWEFSGISVDKVSPQFINTLLNITVNTTGINEDLQYKIVWQRDDWEEWGILKSFSESNTVSWQPDKAGSYEIIVNINDGVKVVSKSITYEIVDEGCTIDNLAILTEAPYRTGKAIDLALNTNGENEYLQYKFVWQRNNWEDWGTIQNFSTNNIVQFVPNQAGEYTFIVDVTDGKGKTLHSQVSCTVEKGDWKFVNIETDKPSPQSIKNVPINIQVNTAGDNEGLKYKFVWSRNNWEDWGVLRASESSNSVSWSPETAGEYKITVDIDDGDKITTESILYTVTDEGWDVKDLLIETKAPYKTGKAIALVLNTSGNNRDLEYKFVWQRDNWEDWGVIQSFSNNNTASYVPSKAGKYTFIADIRDSSGKVLHTQISCEVESRDWKFVNIETDKPSPQSIKNVPINIQVNTAGDNEGLKYKFVWSRNNWEDWGVLRASESSNSVSWSPETAGEYKITVDIDDGDKITTQSILYTITGEEG